MQKQLLLSVLFISLSGCNSTAPKVAQVPAGQWVDEQIAQSATALSLAQLQLHKTSTVQPVIPLAGKPSILSAAVAAKPTASILPAASLSKSPVTTTTVPVKLTTVAITQPASAKPAMPGKVAASKIVPAAKVFPTTPLQPALTVVAPLVPVAKPSVPSPIPKPVWEARVGDSLRKVITGWSQRANYTLAWHAEDLDYPIEAPLRFEGSYEDAVASIFQLYDKADRPFVVDGRRAQLRLNVSEDQEKTKRAGP